MKWHAHSFSVICPTGVFYGLAFAADKKFFSQSQVQKDSERTFKKFLDLQVKNIDNLIFFR